MAGAFLGLGCAPDGPPNVVLISLDTLRADHLGVYGRSGDPSPNIDALARRGTLFERAYAHAPNTAPSHTSIFTSLYPSVHGVQKHGQVADVSLPTLASELRAAGYATAAFTQLNGETYDYGFERRHFLPSPRSEHLGLGDIGMVFDWLEEQRGGPFFLFLHTYEVHLPYLAREELLAKRLDGYRGPLPRFVTRQVIDELNSSEEQLSDEDLRYLLAIYDAQLENADAVLGSLFDRLRQLRLEDRTVVVLLSDHGEEFGEHGQVGRHSHTLYNELLHVPLILAGPGVPSGRVVEATVRSIDIAPTLLRMAGVESPAAFMGLDLRPLWEGRVEAERPVLAERARSQRALVAGRYKYSSDGRLFDLREDPGELRDVSSDLPEMAARLRRQMERMEGINEDRRSEIEQPSAEIRLTPDEERRLKALGYID